MEPILPIIKVPITVGTMLIFDSDCDSNGHGVGTSKHTLTMNETVQRKLYLVAELLTLLPPAYVVRREGNVLTPVCVSVHRGGGYQN